MAATASGITVAAGFKTTWVTILFCFYIALLLLHAVLTLRQRRARDRVQSEVMWGLFDRINREIFDGDHRTRFTLFRKAPLVLPAEIVPWYRYHQGERDAIALASRSRAHFKRDEGITGRAWEKGRVLLCAPLPRFESRQQFADHYVNRLGIRQDVVTQLSEFMERVQTIFSYGFQDQQGRFLGVLSLDFKGVLVLEDGGLYVESPGATPDSGKSLRVNAREMDLMLKDVESVLTSFALAEGEGVAR